MMYIQSNIEEGSEKTLYLHVYCILRMDYWVVLLSFIIMKPFFVAQYNTLRLSLEDM